MEVAVVTVVMGTEVVVVMVMVVVTVMVMVVVMAMAMAVVISCIQRNDAFFFAAPTHGPSFERT